MRLKLTCPICPIGSGFTTCDYYDDRLTTANCNRGHEFRVYVAGTKVDLLLTSGLNALVAGFTLEAVTLFASARERAIEFFLRILFRKLGGELDLFGQVYKEMSRQSERQYGAFLTLYALDRSKHYPRNRHQAFASERNRYVHQGKIPTPEQAHAFCKLIYEEFVTVLGELSDTHEGRIAARDVLQRDQQDALADESISGLAQTNAGLFLEHLGALRGDPDSPPRGFDDAVERWKQFAHSRV